MTITATQLNKIDQPDSLDFDRLEQRKEFIQRIRTILPLPLSEIRAIEEQYADGEHCLGGLLDVIGTGHYIYSSASEHKPIDYIHSTHRIAFCNLYRYRNRETQKPVAANQTRSVRCPNCGTVIPKVPCEAGPEDLVLVVCPNLLDGYHFFRGEQVRDDLHREVTLEKAPYKNLAFEYTISPWL